MGCCGSSSRSSLVRKGGVLLTRDDSEDWSVPSVVHLELTIKDPLKTYSGGNGCIAEPTKWSEEMFEEKLANRRRDRAQSMQSNRGGDDCTTRSARGCSRCDTNRSVTILGDRQSNQENKHTPTLIR
ncbi:hypothetical protein Pmar_PMAR000080 [Perkinsus marinus ATCC 50983]|uniref:Uncharacterized protein n=1 Tax=Perkinsus marinus (strain ATCC 50983 / TXsc) TaxID=423536 RepID=C5KPU6_PERM5|nr:hypothetical protein Pmar_PMAR000080 [Perkinsus marinus ATCC 50983]EER13493.1 hypothetical protein Pmar_PMAR000080 [Perkinsus marinus ATCC 50983]|eukprot:XP_002781698.1 hypothetical protein Pmar_PMAR000080 [Perkinsus marinus ATCC 50983]